MSTLIDHEQAKEFVRLFEHSSTCDDPCCASFKCGDLKRLSAHHKGCSIKTKECNICRKLLALTYFHAKQCINDDCTIPYCHGIRIAMLHQKINVIRRKQVAVSSTA